MGGVRGARRVQRDGITFRSTLEARAYDMLAESGLKFDYEPKSIVLIKEFLPRVPWHTGGFVHAERIRAHTYTPDFIVKADTTHYLELKGWVTDRYPLQRKLFLQWLQKHKGEFWELHSLRDLKRCINEIKSRL